MSRGCCDTAEAGGERQASVTRSLPRRSHQSSLPSLSSFMAPTLPFSPSSFTAPFPRVSRPHSLRISYLNPRTVSLLYTIMPPTVFQLRSFFSPTPFLPPSHSSILPFPSSSLTPFLLPFYSHSHLPEASWSTVAWALLLSSSVARMVASYPVYSHIFFYSPIVYLVYIIYWFNLSSLL